MFLNAPAPSSGGSRDRFATGQGFAAGQVMRPSLEPFVLVSAGPIACIRGPITRYVIGPCPSRLPPPGRRGRRPLRNNHYVNLGREMWGMINVPVNGPSTPFQGVPFVQEVAAFGRDE